MRLTWNQRRALENVSKSPHAFGATPGEIAEGNFGNRPFLCKSAASSALMALTRKELVECIPVSPMRYRITEAGKAALEGGE